MPVPEWGMLVASGDKCPKCGHTGMMTSNHHVEADSLYGTAPWDAKSHECTLCGTVWYSDITYQAAPASCATCHTEGCSYRGQTFPKHVCDAYTWAEVAR